MKRTRNEYGGFLPLELNSGREFYHEYRNNLIAFNCAKAAGAYLLKNLTIKTLHVPYYLCPNVCGELGRHGVSLKYYHIGADLLPENVTYNLGDAVYLVDYFGIMRKRIRAYIEETKADFIFLDNCHSFFSEPIMQENVYNIYSAKKFFGVPDGAYLIAKNLIAEYDETSKSYSYASYLLSCYENGTNDCYTEKKVADTYIANHYGAISLLAQGILRNVDYERVMSQRNENCRQYAEVFKGINQFYVTEDSIPYVYPLYIGKQGKYIKQRLIGNKIYVSTLWGGEQLLENGTPIELSVSENAIFLPVDQRYVEEDINYISRKVMEYYDETT